jgi:hypothetical protein
MRRAAEEAGASAEKGEPTDAKGDASPPSRQDSGNGKAGGLKRSLSDNKLTRSVSKSFSAIKESKPAKALWRSRVWKAITYGINYNV